MLLKYFKSNGSVPQKIQTEGGVEDMEFPGVSKKYHVEFPGLN